MYIIPEQPIGADVVEDALAEARDRQSRFNLLEHYYKGEHAILQEQYGRTAKSTKTVINHARYITKINVGFLLGNPVQYQTEDAYTKVLDRVLEEYKEQTISNLDKQIGYSLSKYGVAYEFVYLVENEVRSTVIDPRNVIVAYDDTVMHNKLFAITFRQQDSQEQVNADVDTNGFTDITVYTPKEVITYNDKLQPVDRVDNKLKQIPIIEYFNNDEEEGDFEQVITLIDAYNKLQSSRVTDKDQLVDAILALYGAELTPEQIDQLRRERVLSMPADSKAEYLIKALNEGEVEILRKALKEDIHQISMTPNFTDEQFASNLSGVALSFKLFPFEINIKDKKPHMEKGLKERFALYNNYVNILEQTGILPLHRIEVVFNTRLPRNDMETSQMITNLEDIIDKKTLISQLSFVKDPAKTLEAKEEEDKASANSEVDQWGKGANK